MSKRIIFILSFILASGLAACAPQEEQKNGDKISVVADVFAPYDWTKSLISGIEENFDLTLLTDTGTDIHSYQPSAEDIIKLSEADIVIYIGGESDSWVKDALDNAPDLVRQVNMMDIIGSEVKDEEHIEGMQNAHSSEPEADEHIWLSLENADKISAEIANALVMADPENRELYLRNASLYSQKLFGLDDRFKETVQNAKYDTLIFADRFPFRYMTDDYQIKYYAAFPGCSAESEASFETVAFLAGKLEDLKLPAVMIADGSSGGLADTVINNTSLKNQKILSLNSMQSVTKNDISGGMTYVSVMEENLNVLQEALN